LSRNIAKNNYGPKKCVFFQGKKNFDLARIFWPSACFWDFFWPSESLRPPSGQKNLAATQFTVICNLMEDQAAPQKKKSTPKDGQLIRH